METIWFILVALMLTAYVVLDGFDLGVGIVATAGGEERTSSGGWCCAPSDRSGTATRSG